MKSKPSDKSPVRWYDPILLRLIPPVTALLIKLLMLSCRVINVEGEEEEKKIRTAGGAVYVTWHQRMSYLSHCLGSRHVTVMISRSRDGEYGARIVKWLGLKDVRGSSTRGGYRAMKDLIQKLMHGEAGGILADGPLGPARDAKMGSVVIARDAGVPLISVLWGADRCWTLNSWDRYLIPKPFARVVIRFGKPVHIPRSARGEELEKYRKLFEDELNRAARWCDEHFGPERPWRKVKEEGMPEVGRL